MSDELPPLYECIEQVGLQLREGACTPDQQVTIGLRLLFAASLVRKQEQALDEIAENAREEERIAERVAREREAAMRDEKILRFARRLHVVRL